MRVVHGITGNLYALGTRWELEWACEEIGKKKSAIRFARKEFPHVTEPCVFRVKSERHKVLLRRFVSGQVQHP